MPKKHTPRLVIILLILFTGSFLPKQLFAQQNSLPSHQLLIDFVDKDSSFDGRQLGLQKSFAGQPQCADYIHKLPETLQLQGYLAASVDAIKEDSLQTSIQLYLGSQQKWVQLATDSIEKKVLEQSGYFARNFVDQTVNFAQVQALKERILTYYENNGYPFASVYLDSINLDEKNIKAALKVNKGPVYFIDSIRVIGKAHIANHFLQRYLGIPKKSLYSKEKLSQVGKRLADLAYLQEEQPADLAMLGTGSVLNLYLKPRRSSQVNFLIGFLPANNESNKLQLTGDVNLNLKNALGSGEMILVNWQQLQLQSPRLNLGYQHPFIFKSPIGIDFSFNLFKKDSTFLQVNAQFGIQYLLSSRQSGKLFIQQQTTTLLGSGVDTNQVKFTKKLPPNIDVSAVNLGLDYEWNNTNYRLNPRSGNEVRLLTTFGIKTIKKNTDVLGITDPAFNYNSLYDSLKLKSYVVRASLVAAHYFPAGQRAVLKTQLSTAIFSSQNIFRNELFQIGGYRLLRGFDEESIYATRYAVTSAEYRYLIDLNSYLFGFADAGWVKNQYQDIDTKNIFISTGIGMSFETRFGLLNMSFAMGKRSDTNFDLRRAAKIHFGYINYF